MALDLAPGQQREIEIKVIQERRKIIMLDTGLASSPKAQRDLPVRLRSPAGAVKPSRLKQPPALSQPPATLEPPVEPACARRTRAVVEPP